MTLGINPGGAASHKKFAERYGYSFPLLVDEGSETARSYGAVKEDGAKIQRTVFIVDKEGVVRYAQRGMPPDSELLGAIRSFTAS